MLYRVVFSLMAVLSAVVCFSQRSGNSGNAYFYQNQRARLRLGYQNLTFLEADSQYRDVSMLDLSYGSVNGGLHKSQEPYGSRNVVLYTEGIYKFKKVKVAGSFEVNKQWDDSLKNNLNGTFDDATPYYYFASKAGTYERQNYKFNALASFGILPSLSAGLGLDYNYHWTTGSVDPRPDVKIFNYLLKPEIVYRRDRLTLGGQLTWGKGTENSGVVYKNSNYGSSLLYADRIFYLNHGYGYITIKDQSIYQRLRTYKGGALNMNLDLGKWTMWGSVGYQHRYDGNTKERYGSSNLTYYSKWYLDTWNGQFFAEKRSGGGVQQWKLNLSIQSGHDWDSLFKANNYQYHHRVGDIGYHYLLKEKGQNQWGFDIGAHYEAVEKKDLIQAHHVDYAVAEPNLSVYWYRRLDKDNRLSLKAMSSMVLPLKNELTVPPTQVNVFTQNIVYPDYYYWSSKMVKVGVDANWSSKTLLRKKESGFFGNMGYIRQLSTSDKQYEAATRPGKNRLQWRLGFRLYL